MADSSASPLAARSLSWQVQSSLHCLLCHRVLCCSDPLHTLPCVLQGVEIKRCQAQVGGAIYSEGAVIFQVWTSSLLCLFAVSSCRLTCHSFAQPSPLALDATANWLDGALPVRTCPL